MNSIPRLHFANLPTPIEPMPRLSEALGGPQLLIKRDDLTGLAFGGNKTRKLEFLLGEAQERGAKTLITAGAVQSNHCRQTAAAAARFGFACILVLSGEPPERASANFLLDELLCADIVWAGEREHRDRILSETYARAESEGKRPYLVPYGGSNSTGALGYAFAVEEFLTQGVEADWFVIASSSGGTQAGLLLGKRLFGYRGRILGISIDEPQNALQEHVARLASETGDHLGTPGLFEPDEVLVNADYCKAGYGVLTGVEQEAIHLFAKTEGIILDPVYTGRAAAGLIDLVRKHFFEENEKILFWHTGGQPALFAEQYQLTLAK
jgi:D-cysteine desulfhydrase family pyridoxal phosphate-dependent enzyme